MGDTVESDCKLFY